MRAPFVKMLVCVSLFCVTTAAFAGARSGATCTVNDTADAGGLCAVSENYRIDGSIGAIGGVSVKDGEAETLKAGYIGQLTEISRVVVTATPGSVNEGETAQLSGIAELDDTTVAVLGGGEIAWREPASPVASLSAGGLAAAAAVYADTPAVVTGCYLNVTGQGAFLVLDVDPDNFGLYADDLLPDWWQVHYFGTNNPLGLADAINITGRSNRYSYTADLDPTDPASVFEIVAISNQPPNRVIVFRPTSTNRVYRLLYASNLVSGVWTNLPGQTPVPGLPGQMSLSDTHGAEALFYRVEVQVP